MYVIKFNSKYYWCGYNHVDTQLRKAVIYNSKKMAISTAEDCLTEFGPEYDSTILSSLLKRRWGMSGGWMDNPEHYKEAEQLDLFGGLL